MGPLFRQPDWRKPRDLQETDPAPEPHPGGPAPGLCRTVSCTSTREADDQAAVEAGFSLTFDGGAEGWTAGFADLPADFDPALYELDSGHRPLPDGLKGRGLYIQGHNRSDDLFMFFKRQVP